MPSRIQGYPVPCLRGFGPRARALRDRGVVEENELITLVPGAPKRSRPVASNPVALHFRPSLVVFIGYGCYAFGRSRIPWTVLGSRPNSVPIVRYVSPTSRMAFIRASAPCSEAFGTRRPSPRRSRKAACRRRRRLGEARWRFTSRMRSRIRSRSFSATADEIVKEISLPHTSPPNQSCAGRAVRLQFLKRAQRVGGRTEGPVKAGGDNHVAGPGRLKQPLALRPLGERR
jgi:hypothetical protein